MSRFTDCLSFTWRPENDGQPYHVTPGDHGGPTSYGVTLASWSMWTAYQRQTAASRNMPPLPALQDATKPQLGALYACRFWSPVHCEALPAGVDLCVFDFGVGSGPGISAMILQDAAGVVADARIGPVTLAAVSKLDPARLIDDLGRRHLAFYQGLTQFLIFGHGWTRRNANRVAAAHLASALGASAT